MEFEVDLLGQANLFVQLRELQEQSRLLCEASEVLRAQSQQQREQSPWPHPLIPSLPEQSTLQHDNPQPMDVLRAVCELLDRLPLEQQVTIVKALTASLVIEVQGRRQPALVAISA